MTAIRGDFCSTRVKLFPAKHPYAVGCTCTISSGQTLLVIEAGRLVEKTRQLLVAKDEGR
jgi:hypothetical protein